MNIPSSGNNMYPSLNERELAEDRRIINEKLRRHRDSKYPDDDDLKKDHEHLYGDGANAGHEHGRGHGHAPNDSMMDEDMSDVYQSMKHSFTNRNEEHGNNGGGGNGDEEMLLHSNRDARSKKRGGTIAQLPNWSREESSKISVVLPKSQDWRSQMSGMFYIMLSVGTLVSYFFFLGSCKLVNYGQ
jgi:hypothetical protein